MDVRKIDSDGFTICPNCGRHYYPELGERDSSVKIQDQFPEAEPYQREQLVTGLCSEKCWKESIGVKNEI